MRGLAKTPGSSVIRGTGGRGRSLSKEGPAMAEMGGGAPFPPMFEAAWPTTVLAHLSSPPGLGQSQKCILSSFISIGSMVLSGM